MIFLGADVGATANFGLLHLELYVLIQVMLMLPGKILSFTRPDNTRCFKAVHVVI